MSDAPLFTPCPAFEQAARTLDLGMEAFWFNRHPADQARRLEDRITRAATLLSRTAGIAPAQALDAVAQALRFAAWEPLSTHLARAATATPGQLPEGWLDALSATVILMVEPEDDVTLAPTTLEAFEAFGQTLAMLTDLPTRRVLDGVVAALCGGHHWQEVRQRSPLTTRQPLYRFVVVAQDAEGEAHGGYFDESPACRQLDAQLKDAWHGYDGFSRAQQKHARAWVESMLAAQPDFLEAALALAWMQRDAEPARAIASASAALRRAEAFIPKGFQGRILWGHLGNRVYHRLLWLLLELNHEQGRGDVAIRHARKMLRLNPGDNMGVRYLLPLLQIDEGNVAAARRALKPLADEHGLTAGLVRAFVAHADGDAFTFRHELATALFTLPLLRAYLLDDAQAMAGDEPGHRGVQPDLEQFMDFAWPVYRRVPGLRRACMAFLAEPAILQAEQELRACWIDQGSGPRPHPEALEPAGTHAPTCAQIWRERLAECTERVAPAPIRPRRARGRP